MEIEKETPRGQGPLTEMIERGVKSEIAAIIRDAVAEAMKGIDIEAIASKEIKYQVDKTITSQLENIVKDRVKRELQELTYPRY